LVIKKDADILEKLGSSEIWEKSFNPSIKIVILGINPDIRSFSNKTRSLL
jgi:hypothetical protein